MKSCSSLSSPPERHQAVIGNNRCSESCTRDYGMSVWGGLSVVFSLLSESHGITIFQPDHISYETLFPFFLFFFKTIVSEPRDRCSVRYLIFQHKSLVFFSRLSELTCVLTLFHSYSWTYQGPMYFLVEH